MKAPSTTLYGILAREAPVGVLFRRGPKSHFRLIKWNLEDDTFEAGHSFKGRIYERRCDLSPGGTLLIYFAAKYKEPLRSWTAVSKPPWLTALALWPKGNGWNGGGLFLDSHSIHLNHPPLKATPHPDFVAGCRKIRVTSLADCRGEDDTVWQPLLERGGWRQIQRGVWGEFGKDPAFSWKAKQPETWRKAHPGKKLVLEMRILGIDHYGGRWYYIQYRVLDTSLSELLDLGIIDWAEWDPKGDLVYTKGGLLMRQSFSGDLLPPPKQLADFSGMGVQFTEAPAAARRL